MDDLKEQDFSNEIKLKELQDEISHHGGVNWSTLAIGLLALTILFVCCIYKCNPCNAPKPD